MLVSYSNPLVDYPGKIEFDYSKIEEKYNISITVEEDIKKYTDMDTPSNNSFKSYMGYKTITCKSSNQYKLQQEAYTDSDTGIRMIGGRYCIAVGSYYTTDIGTNIDLVMENESIVECVLADVKADIHTDSTNRQNPNGSIVEFIVDTKNMDKLSKKMGDMSYADERLEGEIKYIRVYEED